MFNPESMFKDNLKIVESFDKKVREEIYWRLDMYLTNLLIDIERCESPIEQMMHIALKDKLDSIMDTFRLPINITNQAEIETSRGKYRVDFLIEIWLNPPDENSFKYIVVECDGHEFHEKTKEQAQRDKARDRDLLANGYAVLRFTGSEIWRNNVNCVFEVERAIKAVAGIE